MLKNCVVKEPRLEAPHPVPLSREERGIQGMEYIVVIARAF